MLAQIDWFIALNLAPVPIEELFIICEYFTGLFYPPNLYYDLRNYSSRFATSGDVLQCYRQSILGQAHI